jgi:glycosyltransferase involved in cell wall biosynthesis
MSVNGAHPRAPWVLVAGGFHQRGAMDKANAALARYLVECAAPVHLVAYDVDPDLALLAPVTIHLARRPAGSDLLGEFGLDRAGRSVAAKLRRASDGVRVVVNGGNCNWPDINWVHCVHRAWRRSDRNAPLWFRAKNQVAKLLARGREARSLRSARVILANSERTRRDLLDRLSLDNRRVHTVYLGTDPDCAPAGSEARAKARAWLGRNNGRPLVAFVGALGHDSTKGFDTLWSAWNRLCARPDWDADLVVAGGGLGTAVWQEKIARSPLAARTIFLGFTERIQDVLAAADLLVSPVRYEAYGLNVHEAICRGVPALVSAHAGVAERYPSYLGDLLIPNPEDAADLAMRMAGWRPNLIAWKERVLPFANELRRHTWRQMAEQIVSIVDEASVAQASSL